LHSEAWDRLEPILELFERALSRGERPALDDFVPALDPLERQALLAELAHADLEYRLEAGEIARVEDYLKRFGELRSSPEILLDLIQTEYQTRRLHEPGLGPAEYELRFPDQGEALTNLHLKPARSAFHVGTNCPPLELGRTKKSAAAARPLSKPTQLGDFRILREIGHGGMGVVYEALQVSLGRHVALKVLPQSLLTSAQTRQRFEREARAAARLHHTNIVPVFGFGEQDGMPYYVMQFIQGRGLDLVLEELKLQQTGARTSGVPPTEDDGAQRAPGNDASAAEVARMLLTGRFVVGSHVEPGENSNPTGQTQDLRTVVQAKAPAADTTTVDGAEAPASIKPAQAPLVGSPSSNLTLSSSPAAPGGTAPGSGSRPLTYWQSIARIGFQVADALDYSHKQGVLHRDIKPSNLLLDAGGTVWITDFGLAKADDQQDLTQTGDILGTVRYMPPEAFDGPADTRGDIYALGLTLYELLALRPAFDESDRKRLIKQVTTEEPARLDRLSRAAPRDLVTIVHKAMERNPADRYPTAGALAADLRRFLGDESILARRQTHFERLLRWARRNPGVAALGGVLTAVLVVAAVASLLAASHFNRTARSEREARQEADRRGAAERWERYRSNIAAASAALQVQNTDTARVALEDAPPEHRNWEWHRLHNQLDGAILVIPVQGGKYRSHALAPSRDQVAICCVDQNDVYLHNVTSGKLEQVLRGHSAPATSAAYRPDGKQIATSSDDHTIRLWDPATGREHAVLKWEPDAGKPDRNPDIIYSPDGSRIVSFAYDDMPNTIRLWDSSVGKLVAPLGKWHEDRSPIGFSPDGKRVAVNSGEYVALCDAVTGGQLALLGPHGSGILNLTFSPDGKRIASHTRDHSRGIPIWDGESGKLITVLLGHTSQVGPVIFSPDGSRLLSGGSHPAGDAILWDVAAGRVTKVLQGHKNSIDALAFSPDGTRAVTGSSDRTARLWDGRTGQFLAELAGHTGQIVTVLFSPNGQRVVTASNDGTLRLWKADTGEFISVLRGHGDAIAAESLAPRFNADGSLLVSGSVDGTVRVWDMNQLERNGILKGHASYVYDVAIGPDNEQIASASWDGTARLWNATTCQPRAVLKHGDHGTVTSTTYSRDGRRLATNEIVQGATLWEVKSCQSLLRSPNDFAKSNRFARAIVNGAGTLLATISAWDGTVQLWDAATGKANARLGGNCRESLDFALAFHPDDRMLACPGPDWTVQLWDVTTHAHVATLTGHSNTVCGLAFSADGELLASGSLDKTLRLWDMHTHDALADFPLGTVVYGVAFSPDGTRVAAACADNTIRLIDVPHRQQVAELRSHTDYVKAVAWSADGTRLVSGSGDYTVRIWDMLSIRERAKKSKGTPGRDG
jgi:WD40 repeat protein/serine/threonine protein kinase